MATNPNKEILRLYELVGDSGKNFIDAYINDDANFGYLYVVGDDYIYQEWIIRGRTEKFYYGESTDAEQKYAEISTLYNEGLIYRVKRDNAGNPYFEEGGVGSTKYYIRQPTEEKKNEGIKLTFKVNPTHISVQKRKLFTKIRTKGGWEFQHWGPDIGEISVEGTTGNILPRGLILRKTKVPLLGEIPIPVDMSLEKPTVDNSPLLAAFKYLEETYDNDQSEVKIAQQKKLALEYRSRVYVGHFSDFFYEERGERPFQLYYRFVFLVHYEATSFAATETLSQAHIQRNKETLNTLEQIRSDSDTPLTGGS